jgi:hypothetical protein
MPNNPKALPRIFPKRDDIIWRIEDRCHALVFGTVDGLMTTVSARGVLRKLPADGEGVAWTWTKPAT